jgi:subtilisin-like proprotein convertase family protein
MVPGQAGPAGCACLLALLLMGCAEPRDTLVDAPPADQTGENFEVPEDLPPADGDDLSEEDAVTDPAGDPDDGMDPVLDPSEDPTLDDPPEDAIADLDAIEDMAPDPDVDPDFPWGTDQCGSAASVPDCTILCLTPTTYTDSVTFPSLGDGKVMQLDIQLNTRFILGFQLPFDDLEVSLTSPGGRKITFWNRFQGGNSWGSSFSFVSSWQMPYWWDENFAGTWTLEFRDHMRSGSPTNMLSWCLTPLDPADHATVDTGAHVSVCSTASHEITDYCDGDAPDPCTTHPVVIELQATDLVIAGSAPTLTTTISHPATSELEIVVRPPYGPDITVWNESSGTLPSSFSLTTHAGKWMTGRWALTITDHRQGNTGNVSGFCIEAN